MQQKRSFVIDVDKDFDFLCGEKVNKQTRKSLELH